MSIIIEIIVHNYGKTIQKYERWSEEPG